jgi:hypothetical protein
MRVLALTTATISALLIGDCAGAQSSPPSDSLEITMRLMPEGAASPEAITKTIVLPPAASATGVENSAKGLERANEARESNENRGAGQDTAAEARERGREVGQQMSEQARENRDEAGRGNPDRPQPNPPSPNPPGPPPRP